MTTRTAKGNAFQDWIAAWLQERGWTVHNQKSVARQVRTPRGVTWVSKRNDIFGAVDLIAKKRGMPTLWIQATCHKGRGKKEEQMAAVPWVMEIDEPQIWMKRGDGKVNIFRYSHKYTKPWEPAGHILRRVFYSAPGCAFEYGEKEG